MWWAVLGGALGCYLLKLAGLSVPRRVLDNRTVHRVAGLLPIVLLAALIVLQTFSAGTTLTVDARAVGLAVAGVAVWRRWPFLLVVGLAAATTAAVRLSWPGT